MILTSCELFLGRSKRKMIHAGHVAIIRQKRKSIEGFEGKPEGNRSLEITRSRWKGNIEIDHKIVLMMLASGGQL